MAKTVSVEPITHHSIVVQGNDRLSLTDENGQHIAGARRVDGVWEISADGVPDVQTPYLHEVDDGVIKKLTEHALAAKKAELGPEGFAALMAENGNPDVEGFSTWVPHEARKLHGEQEFNKWKTSTRQHHLTF